MENLKLIAFDTDDLNIISAHLQDAVLQVADLAYLPKEHRLAAVGNRFDWLGARREGRSIARNKLQRRRCAIRFERVLAAKVQGIKLHAKRDVLSLLAIRFQPGAAPGGVITLLFSGGAAIALDVECIEVELRDLGAAWQAKSQPSHPPAEDDTA